MKSIKLLTYFMCILLMAGFMTSCGGGGGGGSNNPASGDDDSDDTPPGDDNDDDSTGGNTTPPVTNTDPATYLGGFVASSDNKIEGGQMEFSFGQTATFWGKGLTDETWSSANGSINETGQYFTPKDFSSVVDDTITMTTSATGDSNTRTVTLSYFPVFNETTLKFKYLNGNQKYSIQDLSSTQAVGVASFLNNSNFTNEGNIKIKDVVGTKPKTAAVHSSKMQKLIESDSRYAAKQHRDYFIHQKYAAHEDLKKISSKKSNRAADPLGTVDTFYVSAAISPGVKTFSKIYSGEKCLIYSEINSGVVIVSQARGKELGDVFEVENPYHPTKKPIFDAVTDVFGNPWGIDKNGNLINGGGRDGEKQVILLLVRTEDANLYGYFSPIDEEEKGFVSPDDGVTTSNGAEIVYFNVAFANNDLAMFSTMAHEFQHLCDYNQVSCVNGTFPTPSVPANFDWSIADLFNEGQSVLAEELNGFGISMANDRGNDFIFNVVNEYSSTISTSTTFLAWNGGSDYGKGYLFWRYIYDSYGEDVVKAAAQSHLVQPFSIEFATGKKIDVLLQEFLLALMQTESSQPVHPKYKISTLDPTKTYFDSTGVSLGNLTPIDYISGFTSNAIAIQSPYVIRLYKILPSSNKVNFTLENISKDSNFSIFPVIIDK